jgi:pimeloyl-ACP methyl ester carboxylesterase
VHRQDADRIVLFGSSFGAEAALAVASRNRVDGVIAVAPSSVVWAGLHAGSWSSHWTYDGAPVPFVPFDADWKPDADPPAFVALYESSLQLDTEVTEAARIRVQDIGGEVLLIGGGDDRVWPSERFAAEIRRTRDAAGLQTMVVSHPAAGHRLLLPGEAAVVGGASMQRGGTPDADVELGRWAWPQIQRMLGRAL